MNKVTLGSTGMRVNRLIFGTLPLGPLQANLSTAEGGALIRHALESGVSMLDTAELLWDIPSHPRSSLRFRR